MSDRLVVVAACGAVVAALLAVELPVAAGVLLVGVAVLGAATRRPVLVVAALLALVSGRADRALAELSAPLPERVAGRARLASDPEAGRFGSRAVVSVGGRRYLAEFPRDASSTVAQALTGEHLELRGRPALLRSAPKGWVRSEHLAGRLAVSSVATVDGTAPWFRVVNGLHRTLAAGSTSFSERHRPLYLGLVVGDDRGGSELTEHRFRASGLAHLLAVSGQNVAFVLAVAGPLLVRLGRWPRAGVALALLVVFVLVTRADPSVLRAGVMAAIAVLAAASGRLAPGVRVLALTVLGLLVVDPLLVHSIGFRLSICATGGLLLLTRPIAERLPGPGWVTVPAAVTLAAQVATAPVLLAFTGAVPTVATLANLLAGPAAGAVMMLGVSVGLLAGVVREPIAEVLQLPSRWLVAWIDNVASVASRSGAPMLSARQVVALAVAGAAVAAPRFTRGTRRSASGALGPTSPPHQGAPRSPAPPTRLARTALGLLACGAVLIAVCWPTPLAPGEHEAGSARLVVGPCGTAVHLASDRSGRVLDGLARLGVRRVDVVVADATHRAAVEDLRDQLDVSTVLDSGVVREPSVGSRIGSAPRGADSIRLSEVPCSLPP